MHETIHVFYCNCREGVLGQDEYLAKWLRKHCRAPILLLANKAERRAASGASGACSHTTFTSWTVDAMSFAVMTVDDKCYEDDDTSF